MRIIVAVEYGAARAGLMAGLGALRHDVIECTSAAAALELLGQHADVTLVIMALKMYPMSGTDLAKKLASERPDVSVLLIASRSDCSDEAQSTDLSVLYRPYTVSELKAAIADCTVSRV